MLKGFILSITILCDENPKLDRIAVVKGSFTYYVITKGRGFRNDYANVIFALSNAEFDYRKGEGV